jgi:cytochrome c oxidase subunit 1
MGIVGVGMSLLFRMQFGMAGRIFKVFSFFLGEKWPGGVMTNEAYLSLNYNTRNNNGVLCANRRR